MPTASRATDAPRNHGWYAATTVLRPAGTAAAANPIGKQQASVASPVSAAVTGAIVSPCFIHLAHAFGSIQGFEGRARRLRHSSQRLFTGDEVISCALKRSASSPTYTVSHTGFRQKR